MKINFGDDWQEWKVTVQSILEKAAIKALEDAIAPVTASLLSKQQTLYIYSGDRLLGSLPRMPEMLRTVLDTAPTHAESGSGGTEVYELPDDLVQQLTAACSQHIPTNNIAAVRFVICVIVGILQSLGQYTDLRA